MDVGGGNSHDTLDGNHHTPIVFHTDKLTLDAGKDASCHTHTLPFTESYG